MKRHDLLARDQYDRRYNRNHQQTEKTKQMLHKTFGEPATGSGLSRMDKRILCDASTSMKQAVAASQRTYPISKWRTLMKTRTAKLATAAAVLITVFVLTTLDRSAATAWSVGQTMAAIQNLNTLHIDGMCFWGPDSDPELVDFDFWVQFPDEDSEELKMRFECDKRIIIVQGKTAYECRPEQKTVNIVNGPDFTELQILDRPQHRPVWAGGYRQCPYQQVFVQPVRPGD